MEVRGVVATEAGGATNEETTPTNTEGLGSTTESTVEVGATEGETTPTNTEGLGSTTESTVEVEGGATEGVITPTNTEGLGNTTEGATVTQPPVKGGGRKTRRKSRRGRMKGSKKVTCKSASLHTSCARRDCTVFCYGKSVCRGGYSEE